MESGFFHSCSGCRIELAGRIYAVQRFVQTKAYQVAPKIGQDLSGSRSGNWRSNRVDPGLVCQRPIAQSNWIYLVGHTVVLVYLDGVEIHCLQGNQTASKLDDTQLCVDVISHHLTSLEICVGEHPGTGSIAVISSCHLAGICSQSVGSRVVDSHVTIPKIEEKIERR